MTDQTDGGRETAAPPLEEQVGHTGRWILPLDEFTDGETLEFEGQFIGFGTSNREHHVRHLNGAQYAAKGETCSGCRWFEARIFRVGGTDITPPEKYLLFTVGETIVPDEDPRYRSNWLISPYEIIEALTTFRYNDRTRERKQILSFAARRVLAQAAHYDDGIRSAYEGRLATL